MPFSTFQHESLSDNFQGNDNIHIFPKAINSISPKTNRKWRICQVT